MAAITTTSHSELFDGQEIEFLLAGVKSRMGKRIPVGTRLVIEGVRLHAQPADANCRVLFVPETTTVG